MVLSSLSVQANTLNVVTKDNCQSVSNRLFRCSSEEKVINVENNVDAVIFESVVKSNVNSFCRTPFPITIDVVDSEGNASSFNFFDKSEKKYSETSVKTIKYSVRSPFSSNAFYDSRCEMTLSIDVGVVDKFSSKLSLNNKIKRIDSEISDVQKLIDLERTVAELAAALNTYSELFETAKSGSVSLDLLDFLLAMNCPDVDCSWTSYMDIILDNQKDSIDEEVQFFLRELAMEIENLEVTGCQEENCINNILNDAKREALQTVISNATRFDVSEKNIAQLISRKNLLIAEKADVKQIAIFYGIKL